MNKIARRTETAELDLQEIAFHISVKDGRTQTADRIIDELVSQANQLALTSGIAEMGTSAPEIGDRIRLFTHRRWVFVFRYESHGIDVLRIVDGSQDYLTWRLG